MVLELKLLDAAGKEVYANKLKSLCQKADHEFIPPLSQRSSTTQGVLQGKTGDGIHAYFSEMMAQPVLMCLEDGVVLGFVSFRENYQPEHYPAAQIPNIYISTLILAPESRGRGLTKAIYQQLFYERFPQRSICTRTWSTNAAHIKILGHFGFAEVLRIPNHRGSGIDTVYYELKRQPD